jgi:hypothetical protein
MPALSTLLNQEFDLDPEAHVKTMQFLMSPPPDNNAVATVFHRGNFLDTPEYPRIAENSKPAIDEVVRVGATLVELDVRGGWIAHDKHWGRVADVGAAVGRPAFNITDFESDQSAVNPPVEGSQPDEVATYVMRGPTQEPLEGSALKVTDVLKHVRVNQLPVNLIFDCKTVKDAQDVAKELASHTDGIGLSFIETAMIKVPLKDMQTPEQFNEAFKDLGEQRDKLKVMWVISPNDIEAFGNEQAMIDSLDAHRNTGRFSIPEPHMKDAGMLSKVVNHIKETKQPWMAIYHPEKENDFWQKHSNAVARGDWNNITDPEALNILGEERVFYFGNGTCCYALNSILGGAEYDGRVSLGWLQGKDFNFITTDRPRVAIDYFKQQGIPDISEVARQRSDAGSSSGRPVPAGGQSVPSAQVAFVSVIGVAALAGLTYCYCRARSRDTVSQAAAISREHPPQTRPTPLSRLTDAISSMMGRSAPQRRLSDPEAISMQPEGISSAPQRGGERIRLRDIHPGGSAGRTSEPHSPGRRR